MNIQPCDVNNGEKCEELFKLHVHMYHAKVFVYLSLNLHKQNIDRPMISMLSKWCLKTIFFLSFNENNVFFSFNFPEAATMQLYCIIIKLKWTNASFIVVQVGGRRVIVIFAYINNPHRFWSWCDRKSLITIFALTVKKWRKKKVPRDIFKEWERKFTRIAC